MDGLKENDVEEKNFFHVHNKGIENRVIFADINDYRVFIEYINEYVSKAKDKKHLRKNFEINGRTFVGTPHLPKNYYGKIEIVTHSLAPTEFNLLVREIVPGTLENFMRSLCTRYVIYYNKKHAHTGRIFQGPYQATYIKTTEELQAITDQPEYKPLHTSNAVHVEQADVSHGNRSKKPVYAFFSIALISFIALTAWSIRNIQTTQTLGAQTTVYPTTYPTPFPTSVPNYIPVPAVDQSVHAMVQISLADVNARANVRAYPASNAPIIAKAMNGDTFEYIAQADGWYEIMQQDGLRGYIAASSLKIVEQKTND